MSTTMPIGWYVAAGVFGAYSLYYLFFAVSKKRLLRTKNKEINELIDNCKSLRGCYWPTFLCFNRHAQIVVMMTILKGFCCCRKPKYKREMLTLSDGQEVALDWWERPVSERSTALRPPIMIINHGITGSSTGFTEVDMAQAFSKRGVAVVLNRRGHGGVKLTRPKFNIIGDKKDMREVVEHINAQYPGSPIILYGESAGSAIVASYLGEYGERVKDANVIGGILVSPAYDMRRGLTRVTPFYENILMKDLPHFWDSDQLPQEDRTSADPAFCKTTTIQDALVNHVRYAGNENWEDYLTEHNPGTAERLLNIKVPTLVFNAEDDPISAYINTEECIESTNILESNAPVCAMITKRGAHVCWFGFFGTCKLTGWCIDFSKQLLKSSTTTTTSKVVG